MPSRKKSINVAIVVLESAMVSGVAGIEDIFTIANGYCKKESDLPFKTTFVSLSNKVASQYSHVTIETKVISDDDRFDIVIIPPLMATTEIMQDQPELTAWLIKMYHKGTLLTAACAGSFLLAKTGLLDHKKATTHWVYESLFREHFPNVVLQSEMILIDEGRIITAGGMSAYMDLALYLVEKYHSSESANLCANLLLVERGRDSQRSYKDLTNTMLVDDEEIKSLLNWMKKSLHKNLSTSQLASKMKLQERSFVRRFKKALNTTPNQYLQNLRIEEAKSLLISTSKSFDLITNDVGFDNESSFRRLFKRETSLNPGEYRKKFQHNS